MKILSNGKTREEVNKARAEYINQLSMQESLLKQKSQVKWFEEGDCNIRYFYRILRERRKKQRVNRIQNHKGNWIKGDKKISKVAAKHFQSLFNLHHPNLNPSILDCILNCLLEEDNFILSEIPDETEIKVTIFSLSIVSTV